MASEKSDSNPPHGGNTESKWNRHLVVPRFKPPHGVIPSTFPVNPVGLLDSNPLTGVIQLATLGG